MSEIFSRPDIYTLTILVAKKLIEDDAKLDDAIFKGEPNFLLSNQVDVMHNLLCKLTKEWEKK